MWGETLTGSKNSSSSEAVTATLDFRPGGPWKRKKADPPQVSGCCFHFCSFPQRRWYLFLLLQSLEVLFGLLPEVHGEGVEVGGHGTLRKRVVQSDKEPDSICHAGPEPYGIGQKWQKWFQGEVLYLNVFCDALIFVCPPVLRQPLQTLFALFEGSGDVLCQKLNGFVVRVGRSVE